MSSDGEIKRCRYCKRRFTADRLAYHESVCTESKPKREVFDSRAQRWRGTDNEPYIQALGSSEASTSQPTGLAPQPSVTEAVRREKDARKEKAEEVPSGAACPLCGKTGFESGLELNRHVRLCQLKAESKKRLQQMPKEEKDKDEIIYIIGEEPEHEEEDEEDEEGEVSKPAGKK